MLDDAQLDALRKELAELVDPSHPGHHLFYEFNANESADPDQILFHALGAWRINAGPARSVVAPGVCCRRGAIARWTSAVLARSDLLQACASRRRRDLAPGLFLLDQDDSDGPHLVLDRAGRFNAREWLCALRSRQSSLATPATRQLCKQDGRRARFTDAEQRNEFKPVAIELKAGECSFHHPLMVHGSYANQHRETATRSCAQCFSRWRCVRI